MSACTLIGLGHPAMTMVALCVALMGNQSVAAPFLGDSKRDADRRRRGWRAGDDQLGRQPGRPVRAIGLRAGERRRSSTNFGLLCLALGPVTAAIVLVAMGHDRRLERISTRR